MWMHDDATLLDAKNGCGNSILTSDPRNSSAEAIDGLRQCSPKLHFILTLYKAVIARDPTTCVLANAIEWSLLTYRRTVQPYRILLLFADSTKLYT